VTYDLPGRHTAINSPDAGSCPAVPYAPRDQHTPFGFQTPRQNPSPGPCQARIGLRVITPPRFGQPCAFRPSARSLHCASFQALGCAAPLYSVQIRMNATPEGKRSGWPDSAWFENCCIVIIKLV